MAGKDKVSRWWHYKHIKAWRYIAGSALSILVCVVLSVLYCDWSYIERSGGLISLFGALLGLRKLLRKGARELAKPNKSLVNGGKFDTDAMWQSVEDTSDSFAQELGLALVILGTLISAFGSLPLRAAFPLGV